MEDKDIDNKKMVIAKPVASRPSGSKFQSFSALLTGGIDTSPPPPSSFSETVVAAIRPKTVRVKPTVSRASTDVVSSQVPFNFVVVVVVFSSFQLK